jgi:predicted enzyme related to lactoylglutathione lyase
MVNGVQDFYYNVSDMRRSVEFYSELFGRGPVYRNDHFSVFSIAGFRFAVHWTGGKPVPSIGRDGHGSYAGGTVTFASDDVAADRKRIEKMGAKVLGEVDEPWGHMLVFEDPDGNVAKLMRPKA